MAGDCYRQAFNLLDRHPDLQDVRLVHGYPIFRGADHAGHRFGHAWLELAAGALVIDPERPDRAWMASEYYDLGSINPEHCRRYTRSEARELAVEHEHFGPWEIPDDLGQEPLFAETA